MILLDTPMIREVLPHRDPMLLLEEVRIYEPSEYPDSPEPEALLVIEGFFTFDARYFAGHFPGNPILPGIYQLEMGAQTLCAGVLRWKNAPPASQALFKGASVRWRGMVKPDDRVKTVIFVMKARRGLAMAKGRAYVGEKEVCIFDEMTGAMEGIA